MNNASAFAVKYAAANAAATAARNALDQAIRNSAIYPDLHAVAIERDPVGYAKCLHAVADIVATLPALRAAKTEADAAVDALADQACWYCHGTGLYQSPTSHFTQGKPLCWKCGGTALNAKARKALAA